jgi:two-component system, NarL family, sensor kinase
LNTELNYSGILSNIYITILQFQSFDMKKIFISAVILTLFSLLYNCKSKNQPGTQEKSEAGDKSYLDSITKLDSLSYSNRINNHSLSGLYAKQALGIAIKHKSPEGMIRAFNMMGNTYLISRKDSSFLYYDKALKLADSAGINNQKAQIIYNIAMIYTDAFDYRPAIVLFDSVIRLTENSGNFLLLSNAYNSLGSIHGELNEADLARQLYDTAYKIADAHKLFDQMGIALANLAKTESDTGKSIALLKEAVRCLRKVPGTEEELATILVNIGSQQADPDSALAYYKSGLAIARLGNIPEVEFGAFNNMVYAFLDKKNILLAEDCLINNAIPLAEQLQNYDWLATLYDTYADVLVAQRKFEEAVSYEKKSNEARIQAETIKESDQSRLVASILNLRNKEAMIQSQRNDLREQSSRLLQTRLMVAALILFIIGLTFFITWMIQRQRTRLQNTKLNSARQIIELSENEKDKVARELHDTIGHMIQGLIGHLSLIEIPDTEISAEISAKIKELGENVRRLSHRMNRVMVEKFTVIELVTGLIEDVKSLTGLSVNYYIPASLPEMPRELVLHAYRILEELLTNAASYALKSEVTVNLAVIEGTFVLSYKDTGPGFEYPQAGSKGMGLLNIFERVKLLGGNVKLLTAPGKGTFWEISVSVGKIK